MPIFLKADAWFPRKIGAGVPIFLGKMARHGVQIFQGFHFSCDSGRIGKIRLILDGFCPGRHVLPADFVPPPQNLSPLPLSPPPPPPPPPPPSYIFVYLFSTLAGSLAWSDRLHTCPFFILVCQADLSLNGL